MTVPALFGPYEPDKAPFQQSGLTDMANGYPIANGYAPVGSFHPTTSSLPGAYAGAGAFVGSDASGTLFAATATALYKFSGSAWASALTGLTAPNRWQFTQFGDDIVAVNGGATQTVNLNTGAAMALAGAPTATSIATVRDFVVYGGADGNAALVQWSAFNDFTGNTPGVAQAGYQPMLDGGDVKGIAGGEYGLIIQRRTVRRMTYIGSDVDGVTIPFQFDVIDPEVGAMVSGSITQAGRRVYFLSDRGFMFCDGNSVTPIGDERVNTTFFKRHDRSILDSMSAAIDPRRSTVAWLVPGEPGTIWIYNWALDRWAVIETNAKGLLAAFTTNVSLEDLDTLYPGGIDSIPYSLDDPRFAGGDPLLLLIDNANEFGTLSGPNMPARFTTAEMELIQGRRARVRFVRPLSDVENISCILETRDRLAGGSVTRTFTSMGENGDMPVRANGRYVRPTLAFDAGADWTFVQGVELIYELGGGR